MRTAAFIALTFSLIACDERPAFKETEVSKPPREQDSGLNQPKADNASGQDSKNPTAQAENGLPAQTAATGPKSDNGTTTEWSQTFASHQVETAALTWLYDQATLKENITLRNELNEHSKTLDQIERDRNEERFRQGHSGELTSETFLQGTTRSLDLLVVIDNSSSMEEEQANLAPKLAPLLSFVADTDWQIGVITTDAAAPCLRSLIKKGDIKATETFSKAVKAGINGTGNERGIFQSVTALKGGCSPTSWLRPDSAVAILFVSDEDNCSDGRGCTGEDKSADYLLSYLKTIREPGVNAKAYGLFWHPSLACSSAQSKAFIYSKLVEITRGTWGSICSRDYTTTLKSISADINAALISSFTLKQKPSAENLHVYLDDIEVKTGFELSGNVVHFTETPAEGTIVRISYAANPEPMTQRFTLSKNADPATLNIFIDGREIAKDRFSVNDKNVTFAEMPPENAAIVIRYYLNSALPNLFAFGLDLRGKEPSLTVDGKTVAFTIKNAARGDILLNPPPKDGAVLRLAFYEQGQPIYRYPLSGTGTILSLKDRDTGMAPIGISIAAGQLLVTKDAFTKGRTLEIIYANSGSTRLVHLEHKPIGPIRITDDEQTCSIADAPSATLDVSRCPFKTDTASLAISYPYLSAGRHTFVLDDTTDRGDKEISYKVFINGLETPDFSTDDGETFQVNHNLTEIGTIKISVYSRPPS